MKKEVPKQEEGIKKIEKNLNFSTESTNQLLDLLFLWQTFHIYVIYIVM